MSGQKACASLRAVLCGAVICMLPFGTAVAAETGGPGSGPGVQAETAALPSLGAAQPTAMPEILSRADALRYRRIFDLQEEGRWDEADRLIARLADQRIMSHVLFQRYMHPTAYRSEYSELRNWLAQYADHPGAQRIHRLALQRKPSDGPDPRAPRPSSGFQVDLSAAPAMETETKDRSPLVSVSASTPTAQDSEGLPAFTVGRGTAGSWILPGDRERAQGVSDKAAELVASQAPQQHWNKGLEAWRRGETEAAAAYFQAIVIDDQASGWIRSAGAYWAARAALRLGQPQEMSRWLREALSAPRSFYGLLAQQALGTAPAFDFTEVAYDPKAMNRLLGQPAVKRALALAQAGQPSRAADEIESLGGTFNYREAEALLALIDRAGLPAKAFDLASRMEQIVGTGNGLGTLDVGLFPLPPWRPNGGFTLDRALLYALMRQESAFDPTARSPVGASGLMQLMPRTASYVSGDNSLAGANRHLLLDPAFNLELAQRYVSYLLDYDGVDNNLLHLAVAYNAGPGNLQRWLASMESAGVDTDDPLLFIESLPSAETRNFIRRILTNFWIYRMRLEQSTPSLATLAAGEWPYYEALD